MNNTRLLCSLIFPFALLLSACGGGGSDKKNPQPTSSSFSISSTSIGNDSSGSSTSSSSSSAAQSSAPIISKVTLKGNVAASLSGGELVFTAGSQTFKTTIDSLSGYELELEVADQNADIPLVAVASGAGADKWIQLAGLMPSAKALVELAGEDNLLDETEFFGVNLTALSTAEYAEIANNKLPLTTDAERKAAILGLHPIRALEQAAMVVRLLTDINARLPAGASTTLEYLLDANLAETYLEILRVESTEQLNAHINILKQDAAQTQVSARKMSGQYFLEALYEQYFLTFNNDGSGVLTAGTLSQNIWGAEGATAVNSNFTWLRKGKTLELVFENPIRYKASNIGTDDGRRSCDNWDTTEMEFCLVTMKSIRLELISESNERYLAGLKIAIEVIREQNSELTYRGFVEPEFARIVNLNNLADIDTKELVNSEWVTDDFSYFLGVDGKAKQKNLMTQVEHTVDWSLSGNRLSLTGTDIWLSHAEPSGFNVLTLRDNTARRQSIVKRQPVDMVETDWVGRWVSYPQYMFSYALDFNEDKTWRYGFGPESKSSWSIANSHTQVAISTGGWRSIRDVVAIHDGKYFIHKCEGRDITPFEPGSCYLQVVERFPNFNTSALGDIGNGVSFNEITSGDPFIIWFDRLLEKDPSSDGWAGRIFYSVSYSKGFVKYSKTIVELTDVTRNEIELCEYPVGERCDEVNKKRYVRGVEIIFSMNEGGRVIQILETHLDIWMGKVPYHSEVSGAVGVPKNSAERFEIVPSDGYFIDTVSGCNGSLAGNDYFIPGVIENCEVSVTFAKY